jgi:Trypsin
VVLHRSASYKGEKMKIKRWMLGALALSFLLIQGSVYAQKASFASQRNNVPESASRTAYWTPERMVAARPMPLLVAPGSPVRATESAELRPTGPPETIAGSRPDKAEMSSPISKTVGGDEASSALANYFTYPFPFTRTELYPTTLYAIYPWSTNGKLYFTQPGGDFVCSATSVASGSAPRRAIVLTAGHCVSDGNGSFYTNFLFVPSLHDAVRPFGTWDWDWVTTTSEWHNNGNNRRDVAFLVTRKRSDGQSLGNLVGSAGLSWNAPDKQDVWAQGYPQQAPFTGRRMILCTAAIAARDSPAGAGPATIGIGCDQTPGCSGGSWKRAWNMNAAGYAIGVFSYHYSTQPQARYSPYFDTVIRDLWTHAVSLVDP